jgi:outer membrane protein
VLFAKVFIIIFCFQKLSYFCATKKRKMKNLIVIACILAFVSCKQEVIGYVDNVKLMNDYQEKIDVEAKYQVKNDALTKRRDSVSQAFQIEAQAFQTKAQGMPQKKAQEEYNILQQRGQFIGQQLQQEEQQLQEQGQTEMDSLVSKVKKEIKAFGKANGYTYILGGGDGGSVLYGTEANDLTEEVLKVLNEKYKQ